MMRRVLCLLLTSLARGLDDDGCLAQASLRVHADSQQPERMSLFADTVQGLWKAYVRKQLAEMGETVAVDQAAEPSAAHQEEGGSADAEAQETKEATEQLQAVAEKERGATDAEAQEATEAAKQIQAAAKEEEETSPAQAEEDEQRSLAQEEAEPHRRASELKSAKYGEQMTLL
eukprot:CAMPEP_0179045594 /NCGR_PEP_ID=MMETSP0796-20121207/18257_1 /TAXON_ID=73915 /ORGANISM="Pyrodinium bahamense, Strain pbaha01" /LENGTH=173 /DNA_ID=CAMNT_0020742003 /DNA_START=54 /DNA_END=571 /DNA_ORIENTATION=+